LNAFEDFRPRRQIAQPPTPLDSGLRQTDHLFHSCDPMIASLHSPKGPRMYLPAKDADLNLWALNFDTLLTAAPATYG
jgi:hypothetical protein